MVLHVASGMQHVLSSVAFTQLNPAQDVVEAVDTRPFEAVQKDATEFTMVLHLELTVGFRHLQSPAVAQGHQVCAVPPECAGPHCKQSASVAATVVVPQYFPSASALVPDAEVPEK